MNIRPVTMDFLFQAGWDWIGLYAKYSPIDLFENGKGPKVHPVSIGLKELILYFFDGDREVLQTYPAIWPFLNRGNKMNFAI